MGMRLAVFRDLMKLLKRSRRWWLAPLISILTLLGLALVGLQAVQYISPFIYAVI